MTDRPYARTVPKIDPTRRPPGGRPAERRPPGGRPDGTPIDPDRVEIGPTALAFAEWAERGITPPNLEAVRGYRLQRIVEQLHQRDYGAVLLFDPLNIRYATDTTNMQLWVAHNPSRACLVTASGHVVLWDFKGCEHLSRHLPRVNEVRTGAAFFYFMVGTREHEAANAFVDEVDDLLRQHAGSNRRLALDRIEPVGLHALEACGVHIESGGELMEHARAIKCADEINAMRCAVATTEIAIGAMHAALEPGIAEVELWSILHAENIKRGGEWIETRILSSGPRTNPWMQEAGPRELHAGDFLAFDTDLIGPYGMCADISRTWLVGDVAPTNEQRVLYQTAHEHIMVNREMCKPGVSFRDLTFNGHPLPAEYVPQRYGVKFHGVGLCDEYPCITYPEDYKPGAFDFALEPGMCLCVEVYLGAVGGRHGVKLEDQIVITEDGFENLSTYPFEETLLA
ncbi:MAG: Xaa-Pro peptidase family protein [Pseudomonadota bacterium]